jgi:hypothetical protein
MIMRQLKIIEESIFPMLVLYRRGKLDLHDEVVDSPYLLQNVTKSSVNIDKKPRMLCAFAQGQIMTSKPFSLLLELENNDNVLNLDYSKSSNNRGVSMIAFTFRCKDYYII